MSKTTYSRVRGYGTAIEVWAHKMVEAARVAVTARALQDVLAGRWTSLIRGPRSASLVQEGTSNTSSAISSSEEVAHGLATLCGSFVLRGLLCRLGSNSDLGQGRKVSEFEIIRVRNDIKKDGGCGKQR